MEGVWSEQNTSPAAIEEGLRALLREQGPQTLVPARALNLVTVVDKEWRGEVENRLDAINQFHPSRIVICVVEAGRTSLDAWAVMEPDSAAMSNGLRPCRERIKIDVGPSHLSHLHSVVGPLLVRDLPTIVWSPHGYPDAVDSLIKVAEVVLVDPFAQPDMGAALARAGDLARRAYVVDLAWLRGKPWRERLAALFDPPTWRPELTRLRAVSVRHAVNSAGTALLFAGWLASRLDWEPAALTSGGGVLEGWAHGYRQRIRVKLAPEARLEVPGLAGVAVETASGMEASLDRVAGGLAAIRRSARGQSVKWTLLGASRGEGGILREGISQALLREATYQPALVAARAMLPG